MGGGVAGWLTPGWMTYDKTLSPHIATPGKQIKTCITINNSLCEANVKGGRESKVITN